MHGWDCFGKENNSSRRVISKIEPELNKLNSILSRSAVTPVFPERKSAERERERGKKWRERDSNRKKERKRDKKRERKRDRERESAIV